MLSSSLYDWSNEYEIIFRLFLNHFFNEGFPKPYLSVGLDNDAVFMSDLSAKVPPSIKSLFQEKLDYLKNKGAYNVVLCGGMKFSMS